MSESRQGVPIEVVHEIESAGCALDGAIGFLQLLMDDESVKELTFDQRFSLTEGALEKAKAARKLVDGAAYEKHTIAPKSVRRSTRKAGRK